MTIMTTGVFTDKVRLRGTVPTPSFTVRYSVRDTNVTVAVAGTPGPRTSIRGRR